MMATPRRLRAFALLIACLLALAACGGDSPGAQGASPAAGGGGEAEEGGGGGGQEGGTITFLHWRGEDSAVFDELIADFTEETGISVETRVLPSNQYEEQAQASLTGTGAADVFATFPGAQFANLSGTGVYADVTGANLEERFEERFLEAGQSDGEQLAYPYQLVFNMPVYNATLFEELGLEPPEDWEGFLALCDQLKAADVTPILFAGDISPSQFINPMMMNNQPDEDIWQRVEAGEARVDEEWMVTTLSQIAELQSRGCFQEDPLGTRAEGAVAQMAQGEAGMIATGSYSMAQIATANPDIELGLLAPITVEADQAEWEGIFTTTFMLGVNAESDNVEGATAFLEFLTRPEIASRYANATGQLLTLSDVEYETAALQAQTEWIDRNTRFQPRFLITKGEINTALQTAVEDVLSGIPPADAAATFQATVDRVLAAG
jgi:raffinose/stachyose/melibiose transport system substrate-binding protein